MINQKPHSFNEYGCWYEQVCKHFDTDNCSCNCERYSKMFYLMSQSRIPNKKQYGIKLKPEDCDYEAFVRLKEIKDNIKSFVDNGGRLLIYSKFAGNGKTSWTFKLMASYFNQIWAESGSRCRGIYFHVSDLFTIFQEQINSFNPDVENMLKELKTCDLVIFDDVAITKLSDYRNEKLATIIEHRLNNGLACIFTSNLDFSQMSNYMDSRLVSRIWNGSEVIVFYGADERSRLN